MDVAQCVEVNTTPARRNWGELHKVGAEHFRSIFRAVVIYCTLCRFDDFSRLKDSNFTDNGNHVEIIFERSKNRPIWRQFSLCDSGT